MHTTQPNISATMAAIDAWWDLARQQATRPPPATPTRTPPPPTPPTNATPATQPSPPMHETGHDAGSETGENADRASGEYRGQNTMAELAERVASATRSMPATPSSSAPLSIDDAMARMKAVTQIRPRTADEVDRTSPEYAFGESFNGMVQHIVTGYLDKAVVPIIHRTIMSEVDRVAKES